MVRDSAAARGACPSGQQETLGLGLAATEARGHRHRQGRIQNLPHERRRRVVRARRTPRIGGHDPFEHPPEHVRGDVAAARALVHGELESLEETVECVAPGGDSGMSAR